MRNQNAYHYLLLLLVVCFPVEKLFAEKAQDSPPAKMLFQQSKRLKNSDPDSSYHLLLLAEKQVAEQTDRHLSYAVYTELAQRETDNKDYKKAVIANLNALRVAEEINRPQLIAAAHYALAQNYKPLKLYAEMAVHLSKAERHYTWLKDAKKRANVHVFQGHNSVDLALQKHDPRLLDEALAYYLKAKDYYHKTGQRERETVVLIALGNLYLRYYSMKGRDTYKQASIRYSEAGLKLIHYDSTNPLAAYCIANIGEAYGISGDRTKEQFYYERSLPLYRKAGEVAATHEQLLLLATSYTATGDYQKAYNYLEEYLDYDREHPVAGAKHQYYEKMAELLYAKGDYSGAYRYRLLYEESAVFRLQEATEQEILRLRVVNEIIEKDKEISVLRENKDLQSANLANESAIRNLLLGGVALALLLALVLYFRYKEKTRLTSMMMIKNLELEQLSIVARETMNGVVITDKNGQPQWMNEGYKRMFGWESIKDFLHHLGDDFLSLSSLTSEELKRYQETAIREHRSITYKSVNSTKSGRRLDIQTSMTPVFDSNGELNYWVLVETDITEINMARESAEREQKISENALKIQELFIANVSHEIRTPMNGIMGLSRQLNDIAITGQQKEIASAILKTSSGLLHVVNDLLDLSKIRAGKMNFRSVPFELRGTIETIRRTLQLRLEEKGLVFRFTRDPEVPDWLTGDPGRLNQVLLNLLNNAIKFTEQGAIGLDIRLIDKTAANCQLAFVVSDTGIGIPADKQQFVFEHFAQLEDHRTRSAGGTGLGLGICKTLAEAMGGTISLQSEVGKGSLFTATIPFGLVHDKPTELAQVHPDKPLKGVRILLVEDNKVNQRVAVYELTSWGAVVQVAGHAEAAFEALHDAAFDLILMDISMPKLDGLQATRIIRSDFPEPVRSLPVIAMTASAMTSDFSRYEEAGMNDAISKPYEPEQLLSLLLKWLNGHKPQTEQEPSTEPLTSETTLIDLSVLHSRAKDDKAYLADMFRVFLENMPLYLRDLSASVRDHDPDEVHSDAHRMLGPARLFGLVTITRTLERMEKVTKDEVHQLPEWLQQIEEDYRLVEVFVQDELHRLETHE